MSLIFKSRIKEISTTTGTTSYTLAGAVTGFSPFSTIGNNNTTFYVATNGTDWETGVGVVNGSTLTRDKIYSSSTGSKINWGSGTKTIFSTEIPEAGMSLHDPIVKIQAAALFR